MSRSRSPEAKNEKTTELSPLSMHSKACTVGHTQQTAADDSIVWPPGVTGAWQCTLSETCVRLVFGKTSLVSK